MATTTEALTDIRVFENESRAQYGIWSRGRIGGYEQSVAMVDTQYILRCEDIY